MRVALALLVLLALLVPSAGAAETSAHAAARLESLPAEGPATAFLAQMERAGILAAGATDAYANAAAQGESAPRTTFRDFHPACDLDGDGVPDLISNDLDLRGPPSLRNAPSKVVAVSGADGHQLWARDNLVAATLSVARDVSYARPGDALPGTPGGVLASADLDGDGVCDVAALGYQDDDQVSLPPQGNEVSYATFHATLRALSGKDGKPIWTKELDGTDTRADDSLPLLGFESAGVSQIRGFPTGFLVAKTPKGFEILVKTTDVDYQEAHDPTGFTAFNILGRVPSPFRTPVSYESIATTEHLAALDAKTGAPLWARDLAGAADAKTTNLTWIAGAADLDGDGWPEVVLDHEQLENPRSAGLRDPVDGKPAAEYGRGMAVTVLEGDPGKAGATRWTTTVLDALVPQPNPPLEEGLERLAWEEAYPVSDVDGDGHPDVVASWLAQEENVQSSPNGVYRTHFALLHGANGTAAWNVRLQGWGRMAPLGRGLVGAGMVDVPGGASGARFPSKSVRLAGLDGKTGATRWTYEQAFPDASYLSYNLALAQIADALAPFDLDGDGVRDLVTPAQAARATGRDQVLLATSSHTYEVRSGADGRVLQTLTAWGPTGRVVPCGDAGANLTVVSGHARRIDVTRFDARTGQPLWRTPIYNDAAPRAATTGVDLEGLAPGCMAQPSGATFAWADLEAYSFVRRHEVVPIHARLDAQGSAAWVRPNLTGEPRTQPLFLASVDVPAPPLAPRVAIGVGVGLVAGVGVGLVALLALSRLPLKLLAAGLVLLVLVAGLPVAPALGVPLVPPAPALSQAPAQAPALVPALASQAEQAGAEAQAEAGGAGANTTEQTFDSNSTMPFTWPIPDITGDGHGDLVADVYCIDTFACLPPTNLPDDVAQELNVACFAPHHLFGLDGANGTVLWNVDVSASVPFPECGRAWVVGTTPLPGGGTGVVVLKTVDYNTNIFGGQGVGRFDHEVDMIDATTGKTLWAWTQAGTSAASPSTEEARAIQVAPILANGTLFVEGIGWSYQQVQAIEGISPPGFGAGPILDDHFDSVEFLARLDLATGKETWRVDAFGVDPSMSRYAWIEDDVPDMSEADAPNVVRDATFQPQACCGDLNGDGVPDVVYREYLWNPLQNANVAGPHDFDARLVAFDGATGKQLWDQRIHGDVPKTSGTHPHTGHSFAQFGVNVPAYTLAVEPAGGNLLVSERVFGSQFAYTLSLLSGRDGHVLWNRTSPREIEHVTLGDANGDGAPDLLVLDYYGFQGGARFPDDRDLPQDAHLSVWSGRDGRTLWTATTREAPADVSLLLYEMRANGVIDADGDGVGDVPVDRPLTLDDQTVVHHRQILSGRDGKPILDVRCVGTFCVPTRAPDLDGDGKPDVAVLSGDMSDLWLTLYGSAARSPVWSRRVAEVPVSGYANALPIVRVQTLGGADALVNMQVSLRREDTFIDINGNDGTVSQQVSAFDTIVPQLLRIDARQGASPWALPRLESFDVMATTPGATPGEQALEKIELAAARTPLSVQGEGAPVLVPAVGAGVAALAGTVALGGMLLRFRRLDKGVPDLD